MLRDKALLLLGFAGAFRRSELTGLRWADLQPVDGGLIIHLRCSKTDLAGRGRNIGIPAGKSTLTCPVRALTRWQTRVRRQWGDDFTDGLPCFVTVGRAGRLGSTPLSPDAVTRLVLRRARQAGLTGRWGGRSLRAGFISTAADLDIPLELIAHQSRHATLDSLIRYIRHDDPLRRNPAANLGL